MTEAMAERARAAAEALGFTHVEVRAGDALDLPVDAASADFVITNGGLNRLMVTIEEDLTARRGEAA